jgi:hypothetical protein
MYRAKHTCRHACISADKQVLNKPHQSNHFCKDISHLHRKRRYSGKVGCIPFFRKTDPNILLDNRIYPASNICNHSDTVFYKPVYHTVYLTNLYYKYTFQVSGSFHGYNQQSISLGYMLLPDNLCYICTFQY